jgi:hypothetical protein
MPVSLMLKFRLLLGLAAVVLAGVALIAPAAQASAGAASSHKGILPPRNPAQSLSPSFLSSCSGASDGSACNSLVLAAIAHARQALEKMGGMSFSLSAYERLTSAEQLFVTVNLERTERGLAPAVVLSKSLDKIAQSAAQAGRDPALGQVPRRLTGGGRTAYLGGTWSGGWLNPLGSDYGWMYDDGPGGDNLDCSTARSAQCWGHRDIILVPFGSASCGGQAELAMGAGHAASAAGFGESDTEILAGVCGPAPTDTAFTWAKAEKLLGVT